MKGDDRKSDNAEHVVYYVPRRPPKLANADAMPPPLPPEPEPTFGAAVEDGLRMLAALETMTSLEPDYSGDHDFAAEASVSIVDATGHEIVAAAFGAEPVQTSFRHASAYDEPGLLLNGYETFLGPGDEAIVEIVEISPVLDGVAAEPTQSAEPGQSAKPAQSAKPTQSDSVQPTSLTERLAAAAGPGGRFLKALSGS
jgi:hypothetical protein